MLIPSELVHFYAPFHKKSVWRVAERLTTFRPRRTGLGALHHPAPSLSHSQWAGEQVVVNTRWGHPFLEHYTEMCPVYALLLASAVEPFIQ